jgi:hypothetical protein
VTNCETCGRPAENGVPTHWLGCEEPGRNRRALDVGFITPHDADIAANECEHDGCTEPKWSDGPRTKFCTTHKDPKSREK